MRLKTKIMVGETGKKTTDMNNSNRDHGNSRKA